MRQRKSYTTGNEQHEIFSPLRHSFLPETPESEKSALARIIPHGQRMPVYADLLGIYVSDHRETWYNPWTVSGFYPDFPLSSMEQGRI